MHRNDKKNGNEGGDGGAVEVEIVELDRACQGGVVHLIEDHDVVASNDAIMPSFGRSWR